MKDKKTLYVLIPLVLLIWGYVGYKFFTYGNDEEFIEPIRIGNIIADDETLKSKPILSFNYKDPFLKSVRNRPVVKKSSGTKKAIKKVPNVEWGNVIYNGFMHNSQNKKKIALLNIDGEMVLGESGKEYDGISLVNIKEDSILISKNQASIWIAKSKNYNNERH